MSLATLLVCYVLVCAVDVAQAKRSEAGLNSRPQGQAGPRYASLWIVGPGQTDEKVNFHFWGDLCISKFMNYVHVLAKRQRIYPARTVCVPGAVQLDHGGVIDTSLAVVQARTGPRSCRFAHARQLGRFNWKTVGFYHVTNGVHNVHHGVRSFRMSLLRSYCTMSPQQGSKVASPRQQAWRR